jgi:hypothetical protein
VYGIGLRRGARRAVTRNVSAEPVVLIVLLIFFLLWAALTGFLWAATAWFQDYIYSEPAAQLH